MKSKLPGFRAIQHSSVHTRRGQATVEYIVLLGFTVVLAGLIARTLLTSLDNATLRFTARLEQNLKAGRAPANVWQN